MVLVDIYEGELKKIWGAAEERYNENRKLGNPIKTKGFPEKYKDVKFFNDIIGLGGEYAVSKHYNQHHLFFNTAVYDGVTFRERKLNLFDIPSLTLEVRTAYQESSSPKRLWCNKQDGPENKTFIFAIVDLINSNLENHCKVHLEGWSTLDEVLTSGTKFTGPTYPKPVWYLPINLLHPLSTLKISGG